MSGCLPLLIQFPIIISLYQIIRKPLTYICSISADGVNTIIGKLQSFGFFEGQKIEQLAEDQIGLVNAVKGLTDAQFEEIAMIENVEKIFDLNFNVFGVLDLSQNPALDTISWLWVIPVITFITSFVGMKISRKFQPQPIGQTEDAAKSMKIMDFTMPLMSVAFTFMFSGAIGIYWIYQNVLNVVQTVIVAKLMPIPACTEEDVRAAEKQLAGKSKKDKKRELDPNRPRPRSLHHIDDDDEDIPASAPEADETAEEKAPSPDAPKLKDDEQDKYRNK
jgi:YidC/Oxa1 family membrane protein insertase